MPTPTLDQELRTVIGELMIQVTALRVENMQLKEQLEPTQKPTTQHVEGE